MSCGDSNQWNAVDDLSPCGNHAGCADLEKKFVFSASTNNTCVDCAPGEQTSADPFDPVCDSLVCGTDEYVQNHQCKTCRADKVRPAGDLASGGNTQCTQKAKCSTRVCPQGFVNNPLQLQTYCAGSQCDAGDDATCCVARAKCSTLQTCGQRYRKDATKNDRLCTGHECTVVDDRGLCCSLITLSLIHI